MKQLPLLFFILISGTSLSQDRYIDDFQWGNKIIANDSVIFVTGFTFKKDGYGVVSFLCKYDFNLNQKWILKIDSVQTNTIDKIQLWNDKLILTGTYGTNTNQYEEATRYLKILDFDGRVVLHRNIGASTRKATNFCLTGNKLFLGYKKSTSIYYSDMMRTSHNAVLEFDLTTHKSKISTHYLIRSTPAFVASNGTDVFVCGSQYKTEKYNVEETFFHRADQNNSPVSFVISADKLEGLGGVMYVENRFVILSYSNPFVENQEKYLRFDYLTKAGELIETKTKPFSQYDWAQISLYIPYIENEFWLFVRKNDDNSYFVKVDSDGKVEKEIKTTMNESTSTDFAITGNKIIHLVRENDRAKIQMQY